MSKNTKIEKGTIFFCAAKQGWPKYVVYGGYKEYSCGIYVNNECEYEIYPEVCRAKNLRDNERYIAVGNVDLKKVILDAIQSAITGESAQEKELNRVKEALALMWFAYENKDGDCPHDFEENAVKEAQEILGPWENCMQKYFGNGVQNNES